MTTAGSEKSKVKFYIENRTNNEKRPTYLDILTRSEVSTIFRARTRMLNVKTNYKNKYKDTTCRGCGQQEETQDHVLNECNKIHKDNSTKTPLDELFDNTLTKEKLTQLAKKINTTEEAINNTDTERKTNNHPTNQNTTQQN